MTRIIKANRSWHFARRLLPGCLLLLFVITIFYCIFYLLSGRQHLVQWYLHLNDCYYNAQTWATDFFTPGIKKDGNMYCAIALAVSGCGIWYVLRWFRRKEQAPRKLVEISFDPWDLLPLTACLATCGWAWARGNKLALPAFDEVFSARNAAGIHPFQCLSYYMLPNNHVFFNFVNNVLFHPSIDKVITGRILSLGAYCGFAVTLFFWLKGVFQNRWLAMLSVFALCQQFFVWGFAFQARGYEMYLLLEVGSVFSLLRYVQQQHSKWLAGNLVLSALGYLCLPSFLYLTFAQILFVALWQLVFRKKEVKFWKSLIATGLVVFLLYLPVLTFSGLEAIARNTYVAPRNATAWAFIIWAVDIIQPYIAHIFSDVHWGTHHFSLALLAVPLLLLFARRTGMHFLFGLFYLCMWLGFLIVVVAMKRLPFERNLIAQYSLSFVGVIMVAHWLSSIIPTRATNAIAEWILVPVVSLALGIHFLNTNPVFLKDTLYEYDVNLVWQYRNNQLMLIPSGSSVGFSDSEFYGWYICRHNGCIVSMCPTGHEQYYVKHESEQLPRGSENAYERISIIDGYEVFRRK